MTCVLEVKLSELKVNKKHQPPLLPSVPSMSNCLKEPIPASTLDRNRQEYKRSWHLTERTMDDITT